MLDPASLAADAGLIRKREAAKPSVEEIKRELGSAAAGVVVDEAGQVSGQVQGHDAVRRLASMYGEWREHEVELGEKMNARIATDTLSDGSVVPAEHAEQAAKRKGLRPKIRWGRPSEKYRYSEKGRERIL